MKPYCEIIVKDILPGLRSAVANELAVNYKLNQSEIAKLLGVSQPSISQYLRKLRGSEKAVLENEKVKTEVKRVCQDIYENKLDPERLLVEFCNICKIIISSELICPLHRRIYKLDGCTLCIK